MIISVIIVAVTVIDKAKAQVGAWRVKEIHCFCLQPRVDQWQCISL
ncbi:MAG: hypothetical protein IKB34_09255 [Clostridia bacterium]|nr:hypothetical protein [Clostridia bacterium]